MSSDIRLYKNVPLDREHRNVVNLSTSDLLSALNNSMYFINEKTDFKFIRIGQNKIRVGFTYAECQVANYIAFRNDDYYARWYFAFIDKIEWINPETTEITFTIDVWATYYDHFVTKDCYVIREHVNDDTIGLHTIDEGLSVGDVMCNEDPIYDEDLDSDFYVAVSTNWNPNDEIGYNSITAYTKSVFGELIVLFPLNESGLYNLEHFIYIMGSQGQTEQIHDMFIIPKMLVPDSNYETVNFFKSINGADVQCTMYILRYDTLEAFKSITKGYFIDKLYSGLNVKNNKCYCYPYNYLLVSNNVGSQNIYKYEDFRTPNSCDFQLQLNFSVGVSGRIVPLAYKNMDENVDESIELAKLPTCSWSSDSYTNWLTQNAVNASQRILGSELTTGIARVGEVVSGLLPNQIGSAIGSFSKQQLLPEIRGGSATSDVNFASKNISFRFMRMHAKPEYLKIIDNYFSRFGYKVLLTKIPNMRGRKYWNYVEIGDGENWIYGEIPHDALSKINESARRGITIWHNIFEIGNYDLSNDIE